jgi:hypothetical protein
MKGTNIDEQNDTWPLAFIHTPSDRGTPTKQAGTNPLRLLRPLVLWEHVILPVPQEGVVCHIPPHWIKNVQMSLLYYFVHGMDY